MHSMTEPGVVFTKDWVVDFVLNVAGYTTDRDLTSGCVVEPSCGDGAFLGRVVSRLCECAVTAGALSAERLRLGEQSDRQAGARELRNEHDRLRETCWHLGHTRRLSSVRSAPGSMGGGQPSLCTFVPHSPGTAGGIRPSTALCDHGLGSLRRLLREGPRGA